MKLKHKLHLLKYKLFCSYWKQCVLLSWNQEWTLCNYKKCPLATSNSLTRAYKKALGTYERKEDKFV